MKQPTILASGAPKLSRPQRDALEILDANEKAKRITRTTVTNMPARAMYAGYVGGITAAALERMGLVHWTWDSGPSWHLTPAGREALETLRRS
jgi:hypothetical protein